MRGAGFRIWTEAAEGKFIKIKLIRHQDCDSRVGENQAKREVIPSGEPKLRNKQKPAVSEPGVRAVPTPGPGDNHPFLLAIRHAGRTALCPEMSVAPAAVQPSAESAEFDGEPS